MAVSGQIVAKDAFISIETSATARTVSGDSNSATLTRSVETPEVTAFGDNTRARITGGLKDWTFEASCFFNDTATTGIETIADSILGAQTVVLFGPSGSTSGHQNYSGSGIVSEYSIESPVDGTVQLSLTIVASAGSLTSGSF